MTTQTTTAPPTPEATSPKFVEELNVCLNIETCDFPVFRGAMLHVEKLDHNCVTMNFSSKGHGNDEAGVYFTITDSTGEIVVELFNGSSETKALEFAFRGGVWVAI